MAYANIEDHRRNHAECMRRYRATHPAKIKQQRQDNYTQHRGYYQAKSKKYYQENLEVSRADSRERVKQWRINNPDLAHLRELRRARRERNAPGECTPLQLRARINYCGAKCWIPNCNRPYQAIDHVIALKRGGSNWPSNLRPICHYHNSRKGARDWRDLSSFC